MRVARGGDSPSPREEREGAATLAQTESLSWLLLLWVRGGGAGRGGC